MWTWIPSRGNLTVEREHEEGRHRRQDQQDLPVVVPETDERRRRRLALIQREAAARLQFHRNLSGECRITFNTRLVII